MDLQIFEIDKAECGNSIFVIFVIFVLLISIFPAIMEQFTVGINAVITDNWYLIKGSRLNFLIGSLPQKKKEIKNRIFDFFQLMIIATEFKALTVERNYITSSLEFICTCC